MSTFDFIFMLTRSDRTVPDAAAHVETALSAGVRHIGFKDVGLPFDQLDQLNRLIQKGGATSYLEVVSLDKESELRSVEAATKLGVNVLLGGTHAEDAMPLLQQCDIRYYPFPGRVAGHPSVLEGSIDEIVDSARSLASFGRVNGLDLLAYRSKVDVPGLIDAVCKAVDKPVVVAGSVDSFEQIAAIRTAGASAFTVGTAALDGRFPAPEKSLHAQLVAILSA
jgi:hypothetical protein